MRRSLFKPKKAMHGNFVAKYVRESAGAMRSISGPISNRYDDEID